MIDAIILMPEDSELAVYLKGDLAGILTLAQNKTKPLAKVAKSFGGVGPMDDDRISWSGARHAANNFSGLLPRFYIEALWLL
ncbi:MAG: hypothetical protein HC871_01750 [Rhizobiales bacterium]|nr:hypothetical protein [Hyphomicrobiales bacterium]